MSLNRSEKQAVIDEVTGLAAKAQTLVMAEYRGITVADMTKLRSQARGLGVTLSVLKNTLARRAVAGLLPGDHAALALAAGAALQPPPDWAGTNA